MTALGGSTHNTTINIQLGVLVKRIYPAFQVFVQKVSVSTTVLPLTVVSVTPTPPATLAFVTKYAYLTAHWEMLVMEELVIMALIPLDAIATLTLNAKIEIAIKLLILVSTTA